MIRHVALEDEVVAVHRGDPLHDEPVAVARVVRDDDAPDLGRDAQEEQLIPVMERGLHAVSRDPHPSEH